MIPRISGIRATCVAALLLALGACGDSPAEPAGPPAHLLIVSGNLQRGVVGEQLAEPLTVKVVDAQNRPVSGQLVNFVVASGEGSVFAGASITNAEGIAKERWTLGPAPLDTQTVEARAVDPATGDPIVFATFKAVAGYADPARIVRPNGDPINGTVATALNPSPVVHLLNRYDEPIAATTVTFTVIAGGGSLASSTAVTDAQGMVTVPSWTLGTTAGTNTLQVSAAGVTVQLDATGVAGPAAKLFVKKLPATQAAPGVELPEYISVEVRDAYDNPLPYASAKGIPITIGVESAATGLLGQLGVEFTHVTDEANEARWYYMSLVGTPGPKQLRFTSTQPGIQPVVSGPINLSGTSQPLVSTSNVAGGVFFECAIATDSQTYCWGANKVGQRGIGSVSSDSAVFATTPVAGGLTFTKLAAGASHVCALTAAGVAYCWGDNTKGQHGDTTLTPHPSPTQVAGAPAFVAIVAGTSHSCGLTAAGAVWCWGRNNAAQLGDGTSVTRSTPAPIGGGLNFKAITANGGNHSCGLTITGETYCWGDNFYAQAGSKSLAGIRLVSGSFVQVAVGGDHSCGLTASGETWCWGKPASYGASNVLNVPQRVAAAYSFVSLALGGSSTCGVTSSGAAYCWGGNSLGELGNGLIQITGSPVYEPQLVGGGLKFASMSLATAHSCAVTADAMLFCWGRRFVGDGSNVNKPFPVLVGRGP